jgi:hypothetical protein
MRRIANDLFDELRREVDRSRRRDHPVTLVRVELEPARAELRARRELRQAARRVEGIVRTTDSVWTHGHAVYVLLPETDRDAAGALVSRLWLDMPDLLRLQELRMACFPWDGLTPNALRAAVERVPRVAEERPSGAAPPAAAQPVKPERV